MVKAPSLGSYIQNSRQLVDIFIKFTRWQHASRSRSWCVFWTPILGRAGRRGSAMVPFERTMASRFTRVGLLHYLQYKVSMAFRFGFCRFGINRRPRQAEGQTGEMQHCRSVTNVVVRGLEGPTLHPPPIDQPNFFLLLYPCTLIFRMLTLNKLGLLCID